MTKIIAFASTAAMGLILILGLGFDLIPFSIGAPICVALWLVTYLCTKAERRQRS